ncbi:PerC family transcriptional regulator [Salmonella enterica subsp. enterica serovar Oranienburg]|nr:PerC family transcriptional regulator [Salmonella enterica subsp. enterica serovar Oranienburg]ECA1475084.1 PerC family transcriptional regulator [Salmonella enterica subsp. enterica serovar Oranienburg]ECA9000962.1 PerC family transcriptional regulator [Salmonella enterica subsp. enterica serovar Oranienburg]ECA9347805.1 PerC family transcriptional regulator [Salmonella enterica subsp. enterica serovar Oranienburg]ECD3080902.1 PerC family transcriptional regulator [Salmonella enterica subsp
MSIFTIFRTENKTTNTGQPYRLLRCSWYEREGYMPEEKRKTPTLPDDEIARKLEAGKLWRRAVCRWRSVLIETEDAHVAEQIVQHIAWCRQQVPLRRPGTLILTVNDLRHIDRVARKLGCGPIARYWIE